MKFGKSTKILDDILNFQTSPFDKTGLGYNPNQNTSNEASSSIVHKSEEEPKSYVVAIKKSIKSEENNKNMNDDQQNPLSFHKRNEFSKCMTSRRPFTNRYQHMFLGYYFSCNNFGHKEKNCKAYVRDDHMRSRRVYNIPKDNHANKKTRKSHGDRNYNSLYPLLDHNIECYKCNKFGIKGHDCRILIEFPMEENIPIRHKEEPTKAWKIKQEKKNKEACELALYAKTTEANGTLKMDAQNI